MKIYYILILSLAINFNFPILKVNAAETIILKYGFLRESISVNDLSTFAKTGEMSSSLKNYLDLANQNPNTTRKILTEKITVNGVFLSKILNNSIGERMLDLVSNYIRTPSGKASRESLRGSLVTSALSDNNIQLIEVLENYPTSEVHVEGDRLAETYFMMKEVIDKIPLININL
jgi:hypothetical protein